MSDVLRIDRTSHGKISKKQPWNDVLGDLLTPSWPWNGVLGDLLAPSWPWNGVVVGPIASSWPWNGVSDALASLFALEPISGRMET